MGNSNPIDEIKSLRLEIERLNETIKTLKQFNGTVYSNLSHEIKTPLNGILGFTQVFKDPKLKEEDKKNYTELISESCNMLLSIITDVSDIVKVNTGSYRFYPVKFDLNDLMFTIYQNYKPIAEKKNLQLFLENVISSTFLIESDPDVIQKVLKKLIDNALKFTRQGWVKYYYKVDENEITFFVEDTGIGIENDMREMIFQRFTMLPVSQSRHVGGSGIDLTLCHGLVNLLGGQISLLPFTGEGSTFKFSISKKQ